MGALTSGQAQSQTGRKNTTAQGGGHDGTRRTGSERQEARKQGDVGAGRSAESLSESERGHERRGVPGGDEGPGRSFPFHLKTTPGRV